MLLAATSIPFRSGRGFSVLFQGDVLPLRYEWYTGRIDEARERNRETNSMIMFCVCMYKMQR